MYNDELKVWEGENIDEKKLAQYRSTPNDPAAQYYIADNLLSKYQSGNGAAEAVWLMEKSANADHIPSVLAMAQMFRYGWAVKKSIPTAVKWYKKAAELGSADAVSALRELESSDKDDKKTDKRPSKENDNKETRQSDNGADKKKKRRVLPIAVACIAVAAVAAAAVLFMFSGKGTVVTVGGNTELKRTVSADDFGEQLNELISRYDDEQVISGERPTNRLMLRFEGDKLDLSDFPAEKVIWREDNRVVIQFKNEEDAQRCMEALKQLDGVRYVEEDSYQNFIDSSKVSAPTTGQKYNEKYASDYSDYTYYSWGAIDLGLDCLDAWLNENYTDNSVTVAVVDSGVVPNAETKDRILPGYDCVIGGDGTDAVNGHGTHVAGIVLDATQGLNVNILPVRVMRYRSSNDLTVINGVEYAAEHGADVINLSLGGAASEELDYVIEKIISNGVIVVVTSGNESDDTAKYSPANIEDCIVVSAYDANHNIADFSNYGDSVSVAAPGVDILSYWKDDSNIDEVLKDFGWQNEDDGYRGTNVLDNGIHVDFMNGTSMAAPHITALAAMIKLIVPDASQEQVKKYIQDYCVDMGNREYFGAGICQAQFMAGN